MGAQPLHGMPRRVLASAGLAASCWACACRACPRTDSFGGAIRQEEVLRVGPEAAVARGDEVGHLLSNDWRKRGAGVDNLEVSRRHA